MNRYSKLLEDIKLDPDFIDLTNTNFTTLRPQISVDVLKGSIHKYFKTRHYIPDAKGMDSARAAISNYYKVQRDMPISKDDIFITASTSESYSLIFNSLLEQGDTILLPRPAYPLFEYLARYAHLNFEFYDQTIVGNYWIIDIKDLARKAQKSKAIVLISPNNPTGMTIDEKTLEKITAIAKKTSQILLIDEVFSSYNYTNTNYHIPTSACPIFLLNGISKMLAAPDLKLAWIACAGNVKPSLLDKMETYNDTYLNCSYLTQALLPQLLQKGQDLQPKWLKLLKANRNKLQVLLNNNANLKGILPQGGIHCVLNFPSLTYKNEEIALKLLKEYKLAVHPGYFYDIPASKPYVVISLLNNQENFAAGISRLQDFSIKYT